MRQRREIAHGSEVKRAASKSGDMTCDREELLAARRCHVDLTDGRFPFPILSPILEAFRRVRPSALHRPHLAR